MIDHRIERSVLRYWYWSFLSLVALSAASSKAAGAALVFIYLGAFLFAITSSRRSFALNHWKSPGAIVIQIGLILLGNLVIVYIHGDPLDELTTEVKFFLLALAGYVIYGRNFSALVRADLACYAMSFMCVSSLAVVLYSQSRFSLPANPIPWAAGVGFFSLMIAARGAFSINEAISVRVWLIASSLAGACAVFISQSRGAYFAVFGVCVIAFYSLYRKSLFLFYASFAMLAIIFLSLGVERIGHGAMDNMRKAKDEVILAINNGISSPEVATTSVGSRLYLWSEALNTIKENPLMGVGRKGRIHIIQRAGERVGLDGVKTLGHLHNQYINVLVDRGILGLVMFLYLPGAILYTVMFKTGSEIKRWQRVAVILIMFAHLVASLFNVNYGHNYYGTLLSICLFVVFLSVAEEKMHV